MGPRSLLRRFLWVGLTLVLIAAIFTLTHKSQSGGSGQVRAMSKVEISRAGAALAKGIFLEDQKDDFSWFVKGFNLARFDLKSVTIGVNKKYLYLKYQVFDKFNEQRLINAYTMTGTGFNASLRLVKDQKKVSPYGTGLYSTLGAGVDFQGDKVEGGATYFLNIPDGLPESGMEGYGITKGMDAIATRGGSWLIAAFPLKSIGLKYGDDVIMTFGTETGSTTEFHLAIDPLMGYGKTKCPANIHFVVGESKYTTDYNGCEGSDTGGLEPAPKN